ncbi:Hypothetical protein D9617_1g087490 [Elsinoe fawcettii]|nr:Hypothetical protein D9617_1g087490 [Elsinoe fawcettii]
MLHLSPALANTEKVIFLAPKKIDLPQDGPSIKDLDLVTLSPQSTSFRGALPVTFANSTYPKGRQSWYVLRDLSPRTRYEVRVCWAAVQPTTWDMDVFSLKETMETPELIQSLALFAEKRTSFRGPTDINEANDRDASPESLLFLRISGAADYFTLDKGLMENPKPVKVDIILDRFILNIFPESLVPTAVYIVGVAVVGWFVAGYVWRYLNDFEDVSKEHAE